MADPSPSKVMTGAQREYERKRAQKAGMTLEKWLDAKQKQAKQAELKLTGVKQAGAKPAKAVKPGLLSRLLERANKPLKKS